MADRAAADDRQLLKKRYQVVAGVIQDAAFWAYAKMLQALAAVCEQLTYSGVSKRGWRTEGVGAKKPSKARDSGPFSVPFSYAPLGEWGHISGELLGLFWGVSLSPTPSRQPLFETSDLRYETADVLKKPRKN